MKLHWMEHWGMATIAHSAVLIVVLIAAGAKAFPWGLVAVAIEIIGGTVMLIGQELRHRSDRTVRRK